ncbi:hypothetical protein AC249_AIPGENE19166, partial [Exaiptasia diaphana]
TSKSTENRRSLQSDSEPQEHNFTSACQSNWSARINTPSHLSSTSSLPSSTNRPNKRPTSQSKILRSSCKAVSRFPSGGELVAEEHPQGQWQPHSSPISRCNHNNGCFKEGLGSSPRLSVDKWQMVRAGNKDAYKLSGAKSCIPSSTILPQRQISPERVTSYGQHDGHCLRQQQGGYTLPTTLSSSTRVMGVVPSERNPRNGFPYTRSGKHHGRLGIQGIQGYERMEARCFNHPAIPKNLPDRSVCQSSDSSTEELHQLETRPGGHPHGCTNNPLGSTEGLRIPTIQPCGKDSRKGDKRSNGDNPSSTCVAGTTLVARSTQTLSSTSDCTAQQSNTVDRRRGSDDCPPNVSSAPSGRISCLHQHFQSEGFPSDVAKLLISATRPSTRRTYESSWKRWCGWCSKRKINPVSASINEILSFLTETFNSGTAYRTLNVLRSAISSTHPKIDRYLVGQHPYVIHLLKGALQTRPPQPRYTHTWDVNLVLNYILSLKKNKLLKLKELSFKLLILFALTCPERTSSLAKLDLRYSKFLPEGVTFSLTCPRKAGNPDKPAVAFFASFKENKNLCPVRCLKRYVKATRGLRPAQSPSYPNILFISFIRPHKAVTSTTLGRWLRSTLQSA